MGFKVLIIEDDDFFFNIIKRFLIQNGFNEVDLFHAVSISSTKRDYSQVNFDVILLDLNLIDSEGEQTFFEIERLFPDIAIIILSGISDHNLSLDIVKKGAQDYLIKSDLNPSTLIKSIKYSYERKRLENEVKISEKKFKYIFENSPLPMLILSQDLIVLETNNSAIQLYGMPREEITTKSFHDFNYNSERVLLDNHNESFKAKIIQKTHLGKKIHLEVVANRISYDFNDFIALLIDKTSEVEFEEKKSLLIYSVEERERKNLSMELHDGICQQLVLIGMWLQALSPETNRQKELLQNIQFQLSSTLNETRSLSYQLVPPDLDEGFLKAIESFFNRLNRLYSIIFEIQVHSSISESDFSGIDCANLYRIIQEFVNNSLKHSKCKKIILSILKKKNEIIITISDDGKGFVNDQITPGLGLKNIDYRISIGCFEGHIDSSPNSGTKLLLKHQRNRSSW